MAKIGQLRQTEDLVNFVDFNGEEGAAAERRKGREGRIFLQKRTQAFCQCKGTKNLRDIQEKVQIIWCKAE